MRRSHRIFFAAVTLLTVLATAESRPALAASSAPVDHLTVDSRSPSGTNSVSLVAGVQYVVTARGKFLNLTYGVAGVRNGVEQSTADAECTQLNPDPTYQRSRFVLLEPSGDPVDLYVGGQNVDWTALNPDALGCSSSHEYQITYVPEVSGPLNFAVHELDNGSYGDNQGTLDVTIDPKNVQVDTLSVPTNAAGAVSNISLDPSKNYRVEVGGLWLTQGAVPIFADAECSNIGTPTPGLANMWDATTPMDPTDDVLDLYVNGKPVTWTPLTATAAGCNDTDHTYTYSIPAGTSGPLGLRVNDTYFGDNQGSLDAVIYEVAPSGAAAGPVALPQVSLAESVTVNANNPSGATALTPVQSGRQYLLKATGVASWGGGQTDAECSTLGSGNSWLANRFAPVAPATDLLDLVVNGNVVTWSPTAGNLADGCNEVDHTYQYTFVASATGQLNFRVNDTFFADNGGSLVVQVFAVDEIPMGTLVIDSADPGGIDTPPLAVGAHYRFEISGTYNYWTGNPLWTADAECSAENAVNFIDHRYAGMTPFADVLDVYVDGGPITWKPLSGTGVCDAGHKYTATVAVSPGARTHLNVADIQYNENSGRLVVQLYAVLH